MIKKLQKDFQKAKKELEECKRPLIFFHDDADGVCSFLLLYRFAKEGKGVVVKSRPWVEFLLSSRLLVW